MNNKMLAAVFESEGKLVLIKVDIPPINASVYITEPLGDKIIIDLKSGSHLYRVKCSNSGVDLELDQSVGVYFQPEDIRLFYRETTKAI